MFRNLPTLSDNKHRYTQKMEFVNSYLKIHHLPTQLQARVLSFYRHCWQQLKSFPFSEHAILDELSPFLRKQVVMAMNKTMVESVPFFTNQEADFVMRLILALRSEVFAPRDMVFQQGEVGHDMYFLRQGQVKVGNVNMTVVYTKLYDGAYFGEVALLMDCRRTASIETVYQCDILGLSKHDMDKVLDDFPQAKANIVEAAVKQNYKMEEKGNQTVSCLD